MSLSLSVSSLAHYIAFSILGIFKAVRHFRNEVDGRQLTIFTSHKSHTIILLSPVKYFNQKIHQLGYVYQFPSDDRLLADKDHIVTDAKFRWEIHAIADVFNLDSETIAVA